MHRRERGPKGWARRRLTISRCHCRLSLLERPSSAHITLRLDVQKPLHFLCNLLEPGPQVYRPLLEGRHPHGRDLWLLSFLMQSEYELAILRGFLHEVSQFRRKGPLRRADGRVCHGLAHAFRCAVKADLDGRVVFPCEFSLYERLRASTGRSRNGCSLVQGKNEQGSTAFRDPLQSWKAAV